MDTINFIVLLLDATIRVSTPLVLAALAGLFAERSGVVNIALEGKMLFAAFFAGAVAATTGSPWLGLLAAMGIAMALALVHAVASVTFRGDQVISGLAINFVAAGLTVTLGHAWFGQGGKTPALEIGQRFAPVDLPLAQSVADVPVLGQLWSELISGHNVLVYLMFVLVPLVSWVVYRTRFGLRLRAVGENPAAVDTAGISVVRMRYLALIVSGALCGIAGAYLSIADGAFFGRDMTAGRGYLALAALIFAKWRPVPVLGACFLFGLLQSLEARLQGWQVPGIGEVPVQVFQALPYVLTVVLLAGFIGKAVAPKAIGRPYVKER
ncbi:MAG: ABC transporter permease [Alphaproteobacteria bacterium]